MVCAITFSRPSFIAWPITPVLWGQCAKTYRGQELFFDELKNLCGLLMRQQIIAQRNCIDLVGADRRVVPLRSIDGIVQMLSPLVPKSRTERGERS